MEMCVDAATMENSIYSPQKIKIETLYDLVSEKAMALHSNTLAWKISWTEEPGRLWSMGSPKVRHN